MGKMVEPINVIASLGYATGDGKSYTLKMEPLTEILLADNMRDKKVTILL